MYFYHSKFKIALLTAIILLSGCAQAPVTGIEPISLNTIESIKEKIPGRYALIVTAQNMKGTYHSTSSTCSLYDFPYDVSKPYIALIHETLKTSLQFIELVDEGKNINTENYDAIISVSTTNMETKLNIKYGVFTSDAIAFSSITSNINVFFKNKKQSQETFNATRNYTGPLGYVCSKVPDAMKISIEQSSHESALAILKSVRTALLKNISSVGAAL